MPLLRYLVSVGGVLLGLLFWANWYFPPLASEASSVPDVDRSIIRIHSARQWPAAVPIDTTVPMPKVAPSVVIADNKPDPRTDAQPRQAFAYVPPAAPKAPNKARHGVVKSTRYATRETHRRLASSQTNWFPAMW
jgi:hypothetical protein